MFTTSVKSVTLFLLCVVSGILRNMKVAVMLSHPALGAEVIPFLVVWGILPAVFLATTAIGWLNHRIGINQTFYLTSALFCAFLLLYALCLFPLGDRLNLPSLFPRLAPLDGMISHWAHSLLYIVCDLWPIVMINFLFWGAVNEAADEEQARRFYGFVKLGGCVAAIAAGAVGELFVAEQWGQTLIQEALAVAGLTLIACLLFYWLAKRGEMSDPKERQKIRLSVSESVRSLIRSPYLIGLTLMVVGYNLAFTLPLTLFNKQLNTSYADAGKIMSYLNWLTGSVGVVATVAVLASGWITARFGWLTLAAITPTVVLFGSISFFAAIWSENLPLALLLGAVLIVLGKGTKYSVFDVSKEQAFVPLSREMGWRGKAAVDALATPIGKTGSALLFQGVIVATGSVNGALPLIATIVFAVISSWFFGVLLVHRQWQSLPVDKTALANR